MFLAGATRHSFFSDLLRTYIFGFAFALVVATWLFTKRFPEWLRSLRAAGWLSAQGTVESVDVKVVSGQALAQVAYSYLAEGERYAGYFSRQFTSEQDAWDYLGPLKGQPAFVRYQPGNPAASALRTDEQTSQFRTQRGGLIGGLRGLLSRYILEELGASDWKELHKLGARKWPVAQGIIESGNVSQHRDGLLYAVACYVAEVNYSYSVGGHYYSGHINRTFLLERSARKFVEEMQGRHVVVRYKQDSPDLSVLYKQDQSAA